MVEMDVALELEDDVFFADLSKQIALLIMDDDDEEEAFRLQYPSVSFQAFSHASQPMAASPFLYEQACTREIRGTGVFIPRSSLPRRKHRTGRSRQPDKPKPSVSAAATHTPISSTTTNSGSNYQKPFNCGRKSNGMKKHLL